LPEGELKNAIFDFCKKVNFPLKEVYILDASKRSKKANAYFTGFGKNKRIVLFDTLIEQMNTDEIVAVLAHEIGHYKKRHIIKSMFMGFIQTGFLLFTLSLFINHPILNKALGAEIPSFHIGIIAFGLLFSPISSIISIFFNYFSRKNEKEADLFAKKYQQSEALISALKKLAAQNYSHLTPHHIIVRLTYSHPPLIDRIKLLQS
jgi:STE24 endopeptidase